MQLCGLADLNVSGFSSVFRAAAIHINCRRNTLENVDASIDALRR